MPEVRDYYADPVNEIVRKQLVTEGKRLLENVFIRNSPVARHLQECINFMEQENDK